MTLEYVIIASKLKELEDGLENGTLEAYKLNYDSKTNKLDINFIPKAAVQYIQIDFEIKKDD